MDERIGFMTPQQPIKLGANTDKATKCTLNDDFYESLNFVLTLVQSFLVFIERLKNILIKLIY